MADLIKDFSVNGETYKIDYNSLENKPYGKEETEIFFPTSTLTFESSGSTFFYSTNNPLNIPVYGEHYIVNWEGTDYEVEAYYGYNGQIFIGEPSLLNGYDPGPGRSYSYPFLFQYTPIEDYVGVYQNNYQLMITVMNPEYVESADFTFSITHKFVTRLSSVYLPSYLNMDDKEEIYMEEAAGRTTVNTNTVSINNQTYEMASFTPDSNDSYLRCDYIPNYNDKFIVTINGIEYKAHANRNQSTDGFYIIPDYLDEEGNGPLFTILFGVYGGYAEPSVSFYYKDCDVNLTVSVKRITHNVLPIEYGPLFTDYDGGNQTPLTILDVINDLSKRIDQYGPVYKAYHENRSRWD